MSARSGKKTRSPARKRAATVETVEHEAPRAPLASALAPVLARLAQAARSPAAETPAVDLAPTATAPAPVARTAFDDLAERFGLDDFERDVLILAALPALEPLSTELIAAAQGDERLKLPSVALSLGTLDNGHWSAFAADGRLRSTALLDLAEDPVASARSLLLPERVLHHLVGLTGLDETLALHGSALDTPVLLPPSQAVLAQTLGAGLSEAPLSTEAPVMVIVGSDRKAALAVAVAAIRAAGGTPLAIEAETLPAGLPERERITRLLVREYGLSRRIPVIDAHDITAPNDRRALGRLVAGLAGPVLVLSDEIFAAGRRPIEITGLPPGSSSEQAALWRAHLGSLAQPLSDSVERLAAHFTLTPDLISDIAAVAKRQAAQPTTEAVPADAAGQEALADLLWRETRMRSRASLDDLAERIEPRVGWDDIILPARQRETLRTIAAQVRSRALVHEQWGFGAAGSRGLGISALFAGPSGTGKTLAAEVIGAAIALEVYRIDLSGVVSKWVGETERNLKRVFDAAEATSSILVFEEADALFGKRTEVRESHDRYANIEVSYLLQRMESYRGLAILTTNMRSHLDQAFLRRLRFVVDFPFPGEVERRAIWQLAFPENAPREGLDVDRLAQLNVPGGNIKTIALNAAFLAAEAGTPIRMAHVRAAARSEYEKIGKALTDAELRGWTREVAHG